MKTDNFIQLIRLITGRKLDIETNEDFLRPEKDYIVYKITPIKTIKVSFKWRTPKTDEKFLRSFITAFTSKFKEPDPNSYNYTYGGKQYFWNDKTEEEKEFCHFNHASHMYSKKQLLEQIENNFKSESIKTGLIKYGFYPTEYGIGIFCFWETESVLKAIIELKKFLELKKIPFSNEFSDARWVYRFKINLTKDIHSKLIEELNSN